MSMNMFTKVGTAFTQTQDALVTTALAQTPDLTPVEITFNGTWSQGQADTIDKNFKEVCDQLANLKTDVAALMAALNKANGG